MDTFPSVKINLDPPPDVFFFGSDVFKIVDHVPTSNISWPGEKPFISVAGILAHGLRYVVPRTLYS